VGSEKPQGGEQIFLYPVQGKRGGAQDEEKTKGEKNMERGGTGREKKKSLNLFSRGTKTRERERKITSVPQMHPRISRKKDDHW